MPKKSFKNWKIIPQLLNTSLSFLKLCLKTHKAWIAISDSLDLCFVTNIPDSALMLGGLLESLSKSIVKLGIRAHVASYKLFSFFNDENILSSCPDFGFADEIDIAFANYIQFLIYIIFSVKRHILLSNVYSLMILLIKLFNSCFPKQNKVILFHPV